MQLPRLGHAEVCAREQINHRIIITVLVNAGSPAPQVHVMRRNHANGLGKTIIVLVNSTSRPWCSLYNREVPGGATLSR